MKLKILEDTYQVIRLKPKEEIPFEKLEKEEFYSITRTEEELSIVAKSTVNIESEVIEKNWKMIKIDGILDFSLIGILAKISTILANAGISIFALSTRSEERRVGKECLF